MMNAQKNRKAFHSRCKFLISLKYDVAAKSLPDRGAPVLSVHF